jgi:hypothetical protein
MLTWKATGINRSQHAEESTSMFWVFSKVFVDHLKGWFEHRVQDWCNLGVEHRLINL